MLWTRLKASKTAIVLNNTLYMWGENAWGQLGNNTSENNSVPIKLGTLTDWSNTGNYKIAAGGLSANAIKTDGTLWAWGSNVFGQLGDGTTVNKSSPVQVGTLTSWSQVSAGSSRALAIKTDGTLWAWGAGASGQLGDGTTVNRSSPVQIGTLTNWSQVSSGSINGYAIKTDGTLWSWLIS